VDALKIHSIGPTKLDVLRLKKKYKKFDVLVLAEYTCPYQFEIVVFMFSF